MTTFAETLKEYADGQRSVENFPQEMAFYGFVPPLRTPAGVMTSGDVLTAQWFNAIFRDCFRAVKQTTALTLVDDPLTVGSATPFASDAHVFKIGSLALVIATADPGQATSGTAVAIPGGIKFKTQPLMLAFDQADGTGVRPVAMQEVTGNFVDHYTTRARRTGNPADEDSAKGGRVTVLFVGEIDDTVPAAPNNATFAEFERVYPDGQTTWTSPSADQWNNGFIPTHKDAAGKLINGDALAANVLNFVLCDLFRKGGRGHAVNGGYVIQNGALKIQLWKAPVLAGGDRVVFPEPFRKGVAPFVAVAQAQIPVAKENDLTAIGGASIGTNADTASAHAWSGRALHWSTDTTPVSDDGEIAFIAIGFSDKPVALQRFYDSFAATAITYPDGQSNTTTIDADIMASGFKPPVRNADGTIANSDAVTAQSVNTLLKMAYADASAALTTVGGQYIESLPLNGWQGVENSKNWIAWKTITGLTAADWSAGYTVTAPFATKAAAKLFGIASDTAATSHSIVALESATDKTIVLKAASYAEPATATAPSSIRVVLFGVKP